MITIHSRSQEYSSCSMLRYSLALFSIYIWRISKRAYQQSTIITANTEKRLLICFRLLHTANRRKCLKKSKSLRRIAKGANLFLSPTANRKIALFFFSSPTVNCKKELSFFLRLRRIKKKVTSFSPPTAKKRAATTVFRLRRKMLRLKNRLLRCAQPALAAAVAQNRYYFDQNVAQRASS